MKMIDDKEAVRRITDKLLKALTLPKPVLGLAKALGEDETDVKNILRSLRLLGVVVDLHGTKATLVCVLSPSAAESLGRQLSTHAHEALAVHQEEAIKIAAVQHKEII